MQPNNLKGPLLFLSHSGADGEAALALAERIELTAEARARGLKVWIDKRDLMAGRDWQHQIEQAINASNAFAVYVGSKGIINWVEREVRAGLSRATDSKGRYPFIPILNPQSAGARDLPGFARQFQGVRDVENDLGEFSKLLTAVLQEDETGHVRVVDEPFRGLLPFEEAHHMLFFGRETETAKLIDILRNRRLLMVVGDSGSGKSSLIKAGVLHAWRGGAFDDLRGDRPRNEAWFALETRPASHPFDLLAASVEKCAREQGKSVADRSALKQLVRWSNQEGGHALKNRDVFDAISMLAPPNAHLLIYVDQFEELFTQTPEDERREFVQVLLALARGAGDRPVSVVMTIRRDYYGLCSSLPDFHTTLEQSNDGFRYNLHRIRDERLAACIRKPLKLAGETDCEDLIKQVLRDVGDEPGNLALVQMALYQTWNKYRHARNPQRSLLSSYVEIGGVMGALGKAADEVFADKLGKKEQQLAKKLFLRLVRLGDTGGATRVLVKRQYLDERAFELAQKLATEEYKRLVVISGPDEGSAFEGNETVELVHEALISQWPSFQAWLQESSDPENGAPKRTHDQILSQLPAWETAAKRQRKEFVLTGAELDQATTLLRSHPWLLFKPESDFIEASRKHHQIRVWAWRGLLGAFILFLVTASGVFYALERKANEEFRKAQNQARISLSRELAMASRSQREKGDGLLALPLAIEAEKSAQTRESLQVLLTEVARLSGIIATLRHQDLVVNAIFSSDGRRVLTASSDHTTRIWDAHTGKPLTPGLNYERSVRDIAFSPEGQRLLIVSDDDTARIWDAETGKPLTPSFKHEDYFATNAFSPDGERLLTQSSDRTILILDARTGEPLTSPLIHGDSVWSAEFSSDGRRVLTASSDHTTRIWDAHTGKPLTPGLKYERSVSDIVFSPEGQRLLIISDDNTARIWDAQTGKPLTPPLKHESYVSSGAFSPDGQRVLTASSDRTARIWDAHTGEPLTDPLEHGGSVLSAAFSADGQRAVTISDDNTARIWDAHAGEPLTPPLEHEDEVNNVAFSPDGERVLTASSDRTARVWDINAGKPLTSLTEHKSTVTSAALSFDGQRVVTATWDGTARIWNTHTGQPVTPPFRHERRITRTSFSSDGKCVVIASDDNIARVWDAHAGKPLTPPLEHEASIISVVFSADGQTVLTVSSDNIARTWDAHNGQLLTRRKIKASQGINAQENESFQIVAFSLDGRHVVTTSDNDTSIRDVQTSKPLTPPLQHHRVNDAAFSPDGLRVVTASSDGTGRVWDAQTGQPLMPVLWHDRSVESVAFSPDGQQVLTGSSDRTARIWKCESCVSRGAMVRFAEKHMVRPLTVEERLRFVHESRDHTGQVMHEQRVSTGVE